jgi:hypothetical protein
MTHLKNSILALCFSAFASVFAQTTPEIAFNTMTPTTSIDQMSYEYVMADHVHLRATPSLKGKKVALLPIGTKLTLWEKSAQEDIIDGIKSNWYRVSIGNDSGWIWGGLIAQKTFGSEAYHDVKFVYGFESAHTNTDGVVEHKHQLRAFKNGVQIDKIVFNANQSTALETKNIGNKGLFNVEDIIQFKTLTPHTGANTGNLYIFWNNGKFTNIANLVDYSDVDYTKTEAFIFPSDMEGVKNTLVLETFITNHNTVTEADTEGTKTRIISHYNWNGHKLSKYEAEPTPTQEEMASTTVSSTNF